jgi:hypothetical protein
VVDNYEDGATGQRVLPIVVKTRFLVLKEVYG